MYKKVMKSAVAVALLCSSTFVSARADITVGVITSMSGAVSSIGIPYSRGIKAGESYISEVNGEKIKVILLDEPTSALDPISTAKVEELVHELKSDYTVAIVTHNMQQAARVSDFTAFMYVGELVEFSATKQMFIKPSKKQTEDYITGRFG